MDFEIPELKPIWEESPELYYNPVILEQELDQLKNEHAKVKYWCSELEEEVKQLKKEIKIKEAENTDLHKLYKENEIKLPNFQAKVLELNKDINKQTADKKKLLIELRSSKEKREQLEKKYQEVTKINSDLIISNRQLEKMNAKYKIKIEKEVKNILQTQDESYKIKDKFEEFELQIKALKTEISHHSDELRSRDIQITGLTRENKILKAKLENALIKCSDSEKLVRVQKMKIKSMNKECSESIIRYSSALKENNVLKTKLDKIDETLLINDEFKANERRLYRQIFAFKRMILVQQLENKKLIELARKLEKQKTKFIYTGEDITLIKHSLEECMQQNVDLTKKFSNLDCPFYRSKFGQTEDNEPMLKCGSLKERHYENKIFALEQEIKELHTKHDIQEEKQTQYRRVVVRSLYDLKIAQDNQKAAEALLEKQKYEIIYDKAKVLEKDARIQTLEIQKEDYENDCKVLNRQSALLCKRIKNDSKKIESLKKNNLRANKVFESVEQKNEELLGITEQSKKLKKIMKTQSENNIKCQERQQLAADEMRSTIEEFREKIYKMQELLNNSKQKNDELTNTVEQLKTSSELNNKIQSQNINDAKIEIRKLSIQNKKLTFENKCLLKLEDKNKLLQSRLKVEEQNLLYLQKKFNELRNEKEQQMHSKRLPKL